MTTSGPAENARAEDLDSSPGPLLSRAEIPWLAALVLVAVLVRVAWVGFVNVDPNDGRFDDSVFYHNVGHAVAVGNGYTDPFGRGPTAQWMPGYPIALASLYKPFGFNLEAAKGLNIAFAAATVVLAYLLGRRLFDRRAAAAGALILGLFPGQIFFSTLVYTETMFAAFFMLVLFLALIWTIERRSERPWNLLVIGLLVGLAAMIRAEGLFLLVVLGGVWALTVRPWPDVGRYVALATIGAVLAITPWTVRNAVQFQEFIPLRTNAANAVSRALDPDFEGPRVPGISEPRSVGGGLRYQVTHPWQIPRTAVVKVVRFYKHDSEGIRFILNNRREPDKEPLLSSAEQGTWRGLADRYYYGAGAAAIVAGAVCLLGRWRSCLLLIMAVLGWTAVFAFFEPVPRYHFALGPIIAIFAGAFVILVWDAARARLSTVPARRDAAGGTSATADPTE